MKEKGKVIKVNGEKAVVLMENTAGRCEKCGLCKKISGRGPFLEVKNSKGMKEGDKVEVEIKEDDLLNISIFIFGFPLAGFVLGIISVSFIRNILLKIIVFLLFLVFFWVIGFRKGQKYGEKRRPEIILKR